MKKVLRLRFDYGVLILMTVPFFVLSIYFLRYSPQAQFESILMFTALYLGGAILHHWLDKTLTLELLIEYFLIAALALLIIQGLA